ncbi:MAG: hypothetical protein GX442_25460 [Candidatus Riflebacteria bacterium]|nr:hypothetical protein [Candidatus Riflebacteria bacterium]
MEPGTEGESDVQSIRQALIVFWLGVAVPLSGVAAVAFAQAAEGKGTMFREDRRGGTGEGAALTALLSDVEGCRGRLTWFLSRHPAFRLGEDGRYHLVPGAAFVFGGDAPDRFAGERHVLQELLRLKAETPDRVVLLAGNRDINKLRLPLELSPAALRRPPHQRPDAYEAWRGERSLPDDAPARLRWILEQTMGSPVAFDLRRAALAADRGVDPATVSGDDVVASYLADASPGGLFHRYLQAAVLMARRGPTLFVHAGLPQAALGKVPGRRRRAPDPDTWMADLESWYRQQLAAWEAGLGRWDGVGPRPGEALIRYVERWGTISYNPFSVVYGRTLDPEGKVDLPPAPVVDWLRRAGIRRVVVGHTPSGQVPVVRRTADGGFEQWVIDTSYGPPGEVPLVTLHGADGAGLAVEARLEARLVAGVASATLAEGVLPVSFRSRLGGPGPLGARCRDGAFLVAPVGDRWLAFRVGPGFKLQYDLRSEEPGKGAADDTDDHR